MKFTTSRETLLKPLSVVSGVVEKRQTLPILSNVLLDLSEDGLTVRATDLEMEVICNTGVETQSGGKITVPVRKLQDTCKALPDEAQVMFDVQDEKAFLRSGKTRFVLTTLPAEEFPVINAEEKRFEFDIEQSKIKQLMDKTSFAMATQDVRFYLNGMLIEITGNEIKAVATDGHRLALSRTEEDINASEVIQAILPRKAVNELTRLMEENDEKVHVVVGNNFVRFELPSLTFTTKIIDGKYPNYQAVIPTNCDKVVYAEKDQLRQCLMRTAILSNEKYRGIRLELQNGIMKTRANNPEQEEAEDEIEVDYSGEELAIGFNVNYLTEAITSVSSEQVKIQFSDSNGSALVTPTDNDNSLYVVMPMRL